ncbi:hypothetical protein JK635_15125 [Neobacillus sp. YIM B02564]|uniref:Uncharacterized protein n=1 Tax=Neobacillus paridis TaxID=2803862 RepID=A0ABS1TR44_9BACI|nr:anti-phage protein KwaA [Neobacillus paridis]MBL4953524.1 hypothetical protein [Neobacillus paridis]
MNVTSERVGRSHKIGMYLLSLWLLFLLVIVNKIDFENVNICLKCDFAGRSEISLIVQGNYLPIICLILLGISVLFYIRFKYLIDGAKDGPKIVTDVENKGAEHLVFLATYVIPLVGFGLNNIRETINLGITLFILGAIYVRTNLFYANPTLSLLGFKIFGAKIDNKDYILISIEEIEEGDSINYIPLDKKIYFARLSIKP